MAVAGSSWASGAVNGKGITKRRRSWKVMTVARCGEGSARQSWVCCASSRSCTALFCPVWCGPRCPVTRAADPTQAQARLSVAYTDLPDCTADLALAVIQRSWCPSLSTVFNQYWTGTAVLSLLRHCRSREVGLGLL